jgi:DNA invertase Pin-like site-specific DNA recombinase
MRQDIDSSKVTDSHRERKCCLYARAASADAEAACGVEDLRERALSLGWSPAQVVLFKDGPTTHRVGFRSLLAEVEAGRVGLIGCIEPSRLTRSTAEWFHIVEACGHNDTLLLDMRSVYDPRALDDRILLGLLREDPGAECNRWLRRRHGAR